MQEDLKNWTTRPPVRPAQLLGKHIALYGYKSSDAIDLWEAFGQTNFNALAQYFPNPDYQTVESFAQWLDQAQKFWHTMVFRDPATHQCLGMASYMREDAANGVVEVGSVCHAPAFKRSIGSTEAHCLMAKHVFEDLGYRRYEWKLNNENEPSHRAARRFGFSFEGVFRNHIVAKGKNRDTAWYAMTNADWPVIKRGFERWLAPENFDESGKQIATLKALRGDAS